MYINQLINWVWGLRQKNKTNNKHGFPVLANDKMGVSFTAMRNTWIGEHILERKKSALFGQVSSKISIRQ